MQMPVDLSLTIGGDAGQGVESSGSGFSLALARGGLHIFSVVDYRSRIRGGHNFYQIRVADRPIYSHRDPVHLLLALTQETVEKHIHNLAPGAGVVYDDGFRVDEEQVRQRGALPMPVPLTKIAEECGNRVMMNTAAIGAGAGVLGYPFAFLEGVIREKFGRKGAKVVEGNLKAALQAYDYARQRYGDQFRYPLRPVEGQPKRLVLSGNEAFAMGAAAGGCRFMSAYPMTPATTIFEWMTHRAAELGIVTKHAEDEIAAVCMAIGAGYAGARAMTATSGGGFDLMVEALGMAGMCEIPVVVAEVQRGGPSTGLPTRTEQSDLLYVLNASHGEYPRLVMAPGTIEQYFECGWRAFNLAEKYQTPVIVMADLFLASSLRTVEWDALRREDVVIDRGALLSKEELDRLDHYQRYAFTENGISPRAIPGHPNAVYAISTDEHDEIGHITEEIPNRIRMMTKRMTKLQTAVADMRPPSWYGPEGADATLLCWGSTYGPCREAVELGREEGLRLNLLHFVDLWPLPVEAVQRELAKARYTVCVEQNYTGQFARFLRMTTGHEVTGWVRKFDGRPLAPHEILAGTRHALAEAGVLAGARR